MNEKEYKLTIDGDELIDHKTGFRDKLVSCPVCYKRHPATLDICPDKEVDLWPFKAKEKKAKAREDYVNKNSGQSRLFLWGVLGLLAVFCWIYFYVPYVVWELSSGKGSAIAFVSALILFMSVVIGTIHTLIYELFLKIKFNRNYKEERNKEDLC